MKVVTPEATPGSVWSLLRNGNFFRFFAAQTVSSLGDWVGVIAIAVFAERIGGTTAVGAVMTARVLPGFIMGPLGGVLADRWDRRKTMVVADLIRAVVIFSLPFFPNLIYLLFASAILESLTLVWGPAKDASLPHFVPTNQLPQANSLSLIAIYGPWPLASVMFFGLASLGTWMATHVTVMEGLAGNAEALALWVDSLTFVFSAAMVSTLTIPASRRKGEKFDLRGIRRDLVEGLRFVRQHKQVRPWLLGIAFTFAAAGGVFSLGVEFANKVLGAGERGFASVIGFLGVGMIAGLVASGFLSRRIQRDVLFTSSLFLLGASLIGFASVGSLGAAIPIASALGFFGGNAYSSAYSLLQETTRDELRGRTFSAAYTLIRLGTLAGLGVFPFIAGAIGDHRIALGAGHSLALPGSRITLWLAGLVVIGGGRLSMFAIRARRGGPQRTEGFFLVFEGGEGAGKTTQIEALEGWLRAGGTDVVRTREPGGTEIGSSIRDILLDLKREEMDPRTEALLYAADRAQHVAEVVSPALASGKVVISDRFLDSSLAYQGIARGLGLDEIYEMSMWATQGVLPDLVVYLALPGEQGVQRKTGERDRIESEEAEFHERVDAAYRDLAVRFADRFIVLDASRAPGDVHKDVVDAFEERALGKVISFPDPGGAALGGPLPR